MTIPLRQYWLLLVRYLRPQWLRALTLAILLLAGIGLQLINPQIVRLFIDTAQSPFLMTAEHVVNAALAANARGQVVCIPGAQNKIAAALMKYLPDGITAPLIRSAAEKYRLKE